MIKTDLNSLRQGGIFEKIPLNNRTYHFLAIPNKHALPKRIQLATTHRILSINPQPPAMAFLRRLLARGPSQTDPGNDDPFSAPDPFAPDPNDKCYSDDGKDHSFKSTWAQWVRYSKFLRPSAAVNFLLRSLDVVVGDANGGGASILPVVNEGFVKTPIPRKKGEDGTVEDFMRIPVRKTVKDGLVA
jgi:hypothetical protein